MLNVNDRMYGFTVTSIRDIEEFEGQLIEMIHDRTGAGLVWAKSSEENKLFSVGFRTLPEDNTGVFHILEHSVLCGSEKFPVKEPFVELIKTSMNTFLNAMTYSDKTLYPISSRMEQDYLNLMEVYLDAVFCPSILKNPNIFYQEGWHIDTADDEPVYKGVVFNEMKGAMSDVDQIAERTMGKLLFPDSCYGYNSGGDPDAIPDLTYEDFTARYRKFYHPSNSYFYLDGDIPLEKTLDMINSYLDRYDRLDDVPGVEMQVPVVSEKVMNYSAAGEGEKAVLVFGRIIGTWEDRSKLLALNVLTEQLADSNESPLKRAVLSSGLAEDMEIYTSDGIAQPYLMMIFRGVCPEGNANLSPADPGYEAAIKKAGDRLINIVSDTVKAVADKGLPESDLYASVNQLDFRFRQYPEPQGLYRANAVLSSWLYGGDPALYLKTNEAVSELRDMIAAGEIERFAYEYLADISGFSRLTLIPSVTLGAEQEAVEAARVADIITSMTDDERTALEKLNTDLAEWQMTPDSEEALASIPQLDLNDINKVPDLIPTVESEQDGVRILYHSIPTNGIVYINAYFPMTGLSYEELPSAALLTEFYKDLPTENYSVTELQNRIRTYVGSLNFGMDIHARDDDNNSCTPVLRARAAVLRENVQYAEDLIIEIMTRTRFDDKSLMRELVTQIDEESKRYAVSSGHRIAIYAARSHYSSRDAAAEAINGYTFIQYMHDMNKNFDERIDGYIDFVKDLIRRTVVRSGSIISITASTPVDAARLVSLFDTGENMPRPVSYTSPLPRRFGIRVPASVSHSVQAYDLSQMDARPAGSLSVAANIITFAHLWNEVRVKGGAYGTSASVSRTGSMFCYSYRDPSPAASLAVYKSSPAFLQALAASDDTDLDGFIISTIASTEPLVSPASKGRLGDEFVLSGFSDESRIRVRREILETTADDLLSWCSAFEKLASDGCLCVIGPDSALESCPDLGIADI